MELDSDHRRHAEMENAIRDLLRRRLDHLPSRRFAANGAWLAVQVMAHNLRLDGNQPHAGRALTAKTLPGFDSLAGYAHPLGAPPQGICHGAGPGKTSSVGPGTIARPAISNLTAPVTDPPSGQRDVPANSRQVGASLSCCMLP